MSWRRFLRRRTWDRQRSQELESYLQLETDGNLARGMPQAEARAAARAVVLVAAAVAASDLPARRGRPRRSAQIRVDVIIGGVPAAEPARKETAL